MLDALIAAETCSETRELDEAPCPPEKGGLDERKGERQNGGSTGRQNASARR